MVGALSQNRKVVGSVPSQGTYLDFGFDPRSSLSTDRRQKMDASLPPLLSLKAMKKCPWMRIKKKTKPSSVDPLRGFRIATHSPKSRVLDQVI